MSSLQKIEKIYFELKTNIWSRAETFLKINIVEGNNYFAFKNF